MARSALASFHPLVRAWFRETLGKPSAPQERGWPAIASGNDALILAPTGTGKTLAAFLWELNQLIVRGLESPLPNSVQILYISPLKALNNDVQRNLELPLTQLGERFLKAALDFPTIRVAVRTGDTPQSARARMLRKSPHILITTPESLHIMLTSVRGRGMFSGVRAVIVDEIHAVAGTKRGSHLALTLERLDLLCEARPQRIGLSATQRPLEEIGRFLGGKREAGGKREEGRGKSDSGPETGVRKPLNNAAKHSDSPLPSSLFPLPSIVDCGLVKQMHTVVESPVPDLNHIPAGTIWPSVTPLVLRHIRDARTTLVFVNTRGQAEKMAARLNHLAAGEVALPYHGSLSRERRLHLETLLKAGQIKALVSTSSLELGIDIGSVDIVIQIQSPKRVASGLQRVGRAGHSLGAVSRGVVVPTFRDDALEAVAIVSAMRDGDVEPTRIVHNALDVLAQVVVATVSVDDDWTRDSLLRMVRRAYPYHSLTDAAFDEVLEMLSGKYPSDIASELEARITWDRITGRLSAPRGSRMVAIMSGGTIPDRGLYTVNLPDRTRIGELDEEFVHETRLGDVFQLGSSTWRVQAIEHDRVIVIPAPGAPARMPFWHGEQSARAPHLAARIGALRRQLDAARTSASVVALAKEHDADEPTIRSLVEYVHAQRAATKIVPDERRLVIEQFHDETGALRLVVHTPFGGRVNAPWGMALAHRVREWLDGGKREEGRGKRSRRTDVRAKTPRRASKTTSSLFPLPSSLHPSSLFEIQVQTTDDGIMLRLPSLEEPVPLHVVRDLTPDEAETRVLHEVGSSSLFGARFRMNAARALLLPRGNPRRRMPLWLQRLKALDLLQAVREYPSFPILVETYRDVLSDAFDMPGLVDLLRSINDGSVTLEAVTTQQPSPFASSLQFGFVMDWLYADDAPRAEQRAALLSLDRALLEDVLGGSGVVDAETLAMLDEMLARRRGTAPGFRARTADELSILIDRAGDLTFAEAAERVGAPDEGVVGDPLNELLDERRLVGVDLPAGAGSVVEARLILAENLPRYLAAFGEGILSTLRAGTSLGRATAEDALPESLRRPTLTSRAARHELLVRYVALAGAISVDDIRVRYALEANWIRARLDEWASAGKLVRGTFGAADGATRYVSRRLIEQARRRELARARRAIEAVDMPAYARFLLRWQHLHPETSGEGHDGTVDAIRQLYGVARSTEWWDRDALRARVRDGRVSRDAVARLLGSGELAWAADPAPNPAEARVAAVRFFRRGTGRAWLAPLGTPGEAEPLSDIARTVLDAIRANGASFFGDLLSLTGLASRRLRDGLRELVAGGLATSDSFDALRIVSRWRPMPAERTEGAPDPTRWIPGETGSPGSRHFVVQRRPNLRRLPKWRRPDIESAEPEQWPGRWSLVHTPAVLGPTAGDDAWGESIAHQWLDRYGIVSREHWRRERPSIPWRTIYTELRRLEMRGDVRRGYFVRGLSGAQFARPDAVDRLRTPAEGGGGTGDLSEDPPVIVISAADPANPYSLPLAAEHRDIFGRGRGRGAMVAMIGGTPIVAAESRGTAMRVRPGTSEEEVGRAVQALSEYMLRRSPRPRDIVVETIDAVPAAHSPWLGAFARAGFRRTTRALRYYVTV